MYLTKNREMIDKKIDKNSNAKLEFCKIILKRHILESKFQYAAVFYGSVPFGKRGPHLKVGDYS